MLKIVVSEFKRTKGFFVSFIGAMDALVELKRIEVPKTSQAAVEELVAS